MSFYATGNFGDGTIVICFETKKDRDHFVAWGKADQRSVITAEDAKKHYKNCTYHNDEQSTQKEW